MKVLMFGWEFPPHMSGGLGTACYGLTKSMSKQDVEITFVLPKMSDGLNGSHLRLVAPSDIDSTSISEVVEEREIKFSHLEKYVEINTILHPYMDEEEYVEQKERVVESIKIEKKTHQMITQELQNLSGEYGPNLISEVVRYSRTGFYLGQQENFDVIHAHDWLTYLCGVEAKKVSGKPFVAHIHATEFDRSGESINQHIYEIEKYGMEMADRVIAVSHRTKNMVIERYGIDPSKILVVHNGVEQTKPVPYDKEARPFQKDKIVLFLGRITMQKGPEYFIEAAKIVAEKIPNVRFVMAGSGDMTKKMIEKMASLRLMDRFHFTGFLREAEREKMFAMSDLYIMPSVSEPFGITPLEAMKYGMPIIISKQSGLSEVLEDVIKIDFWDIDELATQMLKILGDDKLAESLGESGQKEASEINWDQPATKVIEVYNNVIEES